MTLDDLRKMSKLEAAVEREIYSFGQKFTDSDYEDVTIKQTRGSSGDGHKYSRSAGMKKKVKNNKKSKVYHESDSSSEELISDSSEESDSDYYVKKRYSNVKHRSKKSGISQKSVDKVKKTENCPHVNLSHNYVTKNLEYNDLDMPLFVAGYLEPIRKKLTKLGEDTSAAKIEHLISIMYLYKTVDWEPIRDMHGAIVREIERGNRSWTDSFLDFEVRMLHHVKSTKSTDSAKFTSTRGNKGAKNVTFCKKYQRGLCSKEGAHSLSLQDGRTIFVKHICAWCWLNERDIAYHSEIECTKKKGSKPVTIGSNVNNA